MSDYHPLHYYKHFNVSRYCVILYNSASYQLSHETSNLLTLWQTLLPQNYLLRHTEMRTENTADHFEQYSAQHTSKLTFFDTIYHHHHYPP